MTETTKRIIAGTVVTVLAAIFIYGSYLPYRKSVDYVAAISNSSQADSFQSFVTPFLQALEDHSPVGKEETFRNFGQTVSTLVGNVKNANGDTQQIVAAFGALLDKHGNDVLERRSGASQTQTYFALGAAYLRIYDITKNPEYRRRGEELLKKGLEISPDRPQFLYSLFEYERLYGTREEARQYGSRIVELWPADKDIERKLKQLDSQ